MRKSIGILTVAAVMLFAQTAAYAAEQSTKEREGAGKGQETQKQSGQETQKQSGQEMQKQSGQEMQKSSGQASQRQSGEMQRQSGQSEQAGSGNFSEEMQRQNQQILQAGKQAQSQCQRPAKSQQVASQPPATQPSQPGQQAASQPPTTPPSQAGREQSQQATQDQGKQTQDQSAAGPGSAQTVKGQFIRMESDFYIIKDQSGKEVCIPSSYATFVDQTFVPGENIVARLGTDGIATLIGRADTQTASAGTQGQGTTGSSEQSSRGRETDIAGSQGAQSQGMAGSTDQPRRDKDIAGSQGSQSQGMGSESTKSPKQQTTASVVKGELLKIQGEFYTVKDSSGNEVRLHVNKETKMDNPVNVGDKIEAERTASDHAVSIKRAQDTGTGSGEGSRTR